MSPKEERFVAEIEGRELSFVNLDKVMYPRTGFTKGELIDYYIRISHVMIPHMSGRPVTVKRFPNGVDSQGFIEKNVPKHAPDWVRTAVLTRKMKGKDTNTYAIVDDLPTLAFFANLAAIEFHTPMWRVDEAEVAPDENAGADVARPDLIVFDLDPGDPATIRECSEVALALRTRLGADGIDLCPKTSGSKGMQLYGGVADRGWQGLEVNEYAHAAAEAIETEMPELVVSRMTRALRTGKVFIDWSQNNPAKTTATPYSLRAVAEPSVSTPVTWDEVERCAAGENGGRLAFGPAEVLERVEATGDLLAGVLA